MPVTTKRDRRAAEGLVIGSEVAAILGVTSETFGLMRARGIFDLGTVRHPMARTRMWSRADVEAWFAGHQVDGSLPPLAVMDRRSKGTVSTGELLSLLGVGKSTLHRWRTAGVFDVEPVEDPHGRHPVWLRADVEAWVEGRRMRH